MGKRDRWDSSSDEEGDDDRKRRSSPSKAKTKKETSLSSSTVANNQPTTHHAGAVATTPLLPRHNPLLQGCRSVYDTYDRIGHVSEGTYGIVWKARDLATDEVVALKQIKFDVMQEQQQRTACTNNGKQKNDNKHGFPVSALREINVLLALSHESIVSVKEMVVGDAPDKVFMVMEYFEFDLKEGISKFEGALFQSELKGIMRQVLAGCAHVHDHWFLHRDLKPSNVLVHRTGRIALADFGLARRFEDPPRCMTQLVVTLWYRAPELLFGEDRYATAIDTWSVGCIFGELICKDAILQGHGELDQIDKIFTLLGVPDETTWPNFDKLPNAKLFRWKPVKEKDLLLFDTKFPVAKPVSSNQAYLDGNGYDLLRQLLRLDPGQRISARRALEHDYFVQGVAPQVPRFFSSSSTSSSG